MASGQGSAGNVIGNVLLGLALIAVSVYLLRGQGTNPAILERKAADAERQAASAAREMEEATTALAAATGGGAALVAYRNLEAAAKRWNPSESVAETKFQEAMASISFDQSVLNSPRFGVIAAVGAGGHVEIFRDWVIYGQEAHEVGATTRGHVYTDGAVQVTSSVVPATKHKKSYVQNAQHDHRTAQLQIVSSEWSLSVPIDPNQANEARRLVEQLASQIETLRAKTVTAADIGEMVDTILARTGQPAAEKLKQLSNLRFDRLLSDEEFDQAKARILDVL